MELVDIPGPGPRQLHAQQLAEEVVVPVPLVPRVQWDEEQVRAREVRQDRAAAGAIEHRVAQRTRETWEDRGAQQEVPRRLVQRIDHLPEQVVRHVSVVAGEVTHAGPGIRVPTEPQRRQVEPGGPALAALEEVREVVVVQGDPLPDDKELPRLVEREREIARPNARRARPWRAGGPAGSVDRCASSRSSASRAGAARRRTRTTGGQARRSASGGRRARRRSARDGLPCRSGARRCLRRPSRPGSAAG